MAPRKVKGQGKVKGKVKDTVKNTVKNTLPLSDQPAEAEATKTTAGNNPGKQPDVESAEDLEEEDSGDEFSGPIYEKFHQSGLDKVHKIDNDGTVWMRRKQEVKGAYKKKEPNFLLDAAFECRATFIIPSVTLLFCILTFCPLHGIFCPCLSMQ